MESAKRLTSTCTVKAVRLRVAAVTCLLIVNATGGHALPVQGPRLSAAYLQQLRLRSIGPANMSGRVVDVEVNALDPYVIYAAAATGGVWKSVNNGTTWVPVFFNEGTHSVGDIAVHPVDTAVVWVGTGERASRQSNSWGDGVYRSDDGGRTWRNVGLRETHHIGRIALHPTDPDVALVAAMGHLWGPNEERGVYRTTDGGRTWERTLYVDTLTGAADVAIDPSNPGIAYAATYQRMRKPWGFDGGGPGSALWKSEDGGVTWRRLGPVRQEAVAVVSARTGGARSDTIGAPGPNGLPLGEWGRVGISIFRGDPRIVYASIEQGYRYNASTAYTQRLAGLYRSEDRGETWQWMSDWNPRPMYASQPLVDPNDDQRIYMENSFSWSDDGGRTFVDADQSLHSDDRFLWVDPNDSRHVIKADDGGLGISWDRARSWLFVPSLPISQWYHVRVDDAFPFNVYGGLQDNGSWMGPSATWRTEGILNEDWRRLGGGDGFLAIPDTVDGHSVYAESQYLGLTRLDNRTWQTQDIRPGDPTGHVGDRRNWDAWGAGTPEPPLGNAMAPANWDGPYIISPHDHSTLYAGTSRLWKSTDQGRSWTDLGDMTTGTNRRGLTIMGRRAHDYTPSLDDGVPYWPTITAVAESPFVRGLLYVGTDDGNVSVSRNGGATWREVSRLLPGLPDRALINGIEPSTHRAGTVYVAANDYRDDDYANYLYRSTDSGDTWESITGDLPARRVVRTVREDPRNADVLWLGTEFGLFVTNDGGRHWVSLKVNMPTLAINDLVVHERDNDLVVATHGRGIWILDDVNAIQEITPAIGAQPGYVFSIEPAYEIRLSGEKAHTGDMIFEGENPPDGAIIDYWLANGADSSGIRLDILDARRRPVRRLNPRREAGVNRVVWDLRHDRFGERGPRGPRVVPGTYVARLTVRGRTWEKPIEVRQDPRVDAAPSVVAQWTADLLEIGRLQSDIADMNASLDSLRRRLPSRKQTPSAPPGSAAARRAAQPPLDPVLTGDQASDVRDAIEQADELLSRVRGVYNAVSDWVGPLTVDQRSTLDFARSRQPGIATRIRRILDQRTAMSSRARPPVAR